MVFWLLRLQEKKKKIQRADKTLQKTSKGLQEEAAQ